MTQDPHRLADDPAGSDLARALRDAQADALSPERVARVGAALNTAGLATTGPEGLGPSSPTGASRPLWAKLLAGAPFRVGLAAIALAVGIGGAASLGMRGPGSTRPAEVAPPAVAPTPPEIPSAPGAITVPPPETPPRSDGAPATAEETANTKDSARAQPRAAVATGIAPASPAGVPSPREGALLLEARSVLATNPARALALVHLHEQEFPASQLLAERNRIAAEARQRLQK